MNLSDLASLHAMIAALGRDDGIAWQHSDRCPRWLSRSCVPLADLLVGSTRVTLYVGPWVGLRLLGRDGEGWRHARVVSGPQPRRVRRPSLAHRLAF